MAELTNFSVIYESFLHTVTDDMYISWSQEDTEQDLEGFLLSAIASFRYPQKNLRDYDLVKKVFNVKLSLEEIKILTLLMVIEWLNRQMTTVRLTELQYTGSDAKILNTKSQLLALVELKKDYTLQYEKNLFYYHNHSVDENGRISSIDRHLSGKGTNNNELLQNVRNSR